jgi:hypothetical protein
VDVVGLTEEDVVNVRLVVLDEDETMASRMSIHTISIY